MRQNVIDVLCGAFGSTGRAPVFPPALNPDPPYPQTGAMAAAAEDEGGGVELRRRPVQQQQQQPAQAQPAAQPPPQQQAEPSLFGRPMLLLFILWGAMLYMRDMAGSAKQDKAAGAPVVPSHAHGAAGAAGAGAPPFVIKPEAPSASRGLEAESVGVGVGEGDVVKPLGFDPLGSGVRHVIVQYCKFDRSLYWHHSMDCLIDRFIEPINPIGPHPPNHP